MIQINYTTIEDTHAAKFCELAAARLRLDTAAQERLTAELVALGYDRSVVQAAAERIARAAIDEEREARG